MQPLFKTWFVSFRIYQDKNKRNHRSITNSGHTFRPLFHVFVFLIIIHIIWLFVLTSENLKSLKEIVIKRDIYVAFKEIHIKKPFRMGFFSFN